MNLLRQGLAALLIVLGAGTANAFDKPPERYRGIPPAVKVIPASERAVHAFCGELVKAPRSAKARVMGCMLNAKPCIVVAAKGKHFAALVLHEIAHCNGWPKNHPR